MSLEPRKILYLNLKSGSGEIRVNTELAPFLGGIGLAAKLLFEEKAEDPVVFATGPFAGFYPFASVICGAFFEEGKPVFTYANGGFGPMLRFAGYEALIVYGQGSKSFSVCDEAIDVLPQEQEGALREEGLRGRRSTLAVSREGVLIEDYFSFGNPLIGENLRRRGLGGVVVSGTKDLAAADPDYYRELFDSILREAENLSVAPGPGPSCLACPWGCREAASFSDWQGTPLEAFLITCPAASSIYRDSARVFSCLKALGYRWTHEEIEALPQKLAEFLREI